MKKPRQTRSDPSGFAPRYSHCEVPLCFCRWPSQGRHRNRVQNAANSNEPLENVIEPVERDALTFIPNFNNPCLRQCGIEVIVPFGGLKRSAFESTLKKTWRIQPWSKSRPRQRHFERRWPLNPPAFGKEMGVFGKLPNEIAVEKHCQFELQGAGVGLGEHQQSFEGPRQVQGPREVVLRRNDGISAEIQGRSKSVQNADE